MKNQLLFIAFFIFTNLNAQIKITQIHLNAGSFMDIDKSKNKISDFSFLAPGSDILSQDFIHAVKIHSFRFSNVDQIRAQDDLYKIIRGRDSLHYFQ